MRIEREKCKMMKKRKIWLESTLRHTKIRKLHVYDPEKQTDEEQRK